MEFSDSPSFNRPMLVSFIHTALKAVGSLFLTVAILMVLIAILLWGTVVEKNYGDTAAKFGIYGSWWFNGLGLILGINSAVALILRWPWRLQEAGFVIPHLGLIVLLIGCYLSRRYGMEASLSVFEGQSSDLAYKGGGQHVELDGQQHFSLKVISDGGSEKSGELIQVPFTSGPFNWDDYQNGTLELLPWSLAHRDQGVLYNHDGIRLEVLDYLSNSEIVQTKDPAGFSARALDFDKSGDRPHVRQAFVRLTVDDRKEEFWIPCSSPDRLESLSLAIPKELLRKSVAGKGRRVELKFAPESFHIGYSVYLHKAWRKLDPGTRQPSFYGSEIDLLPNDFSAKASSADSSDKQPPKYENLLVTLNAPLDFADPAFPGRSYRMFQSSMNGPYNPEEVGLKLGESVYYSGFTLNYDPGRGLTYVGCLLIVAGIFVAYFIRFVNRRQSTNGS